MLVNINNFETLNKLGLELNDVSLIKDLVLELKNNQLIEVDESPLKVFDIQEFFLQLLKNKDILKYTLDYYHQLIKKEGNFLLANCGMNPGFYNFKWNLSLLILLNKYNYLNNYYEIEPLLEMDKNEKKYYNDLFSSFFEMIRLDFNSLDKYYNLFNQAMYLERSGWVDKKLPTGHKESIAEHMYMMQTLAKMYLKEEYEEYPDFNKQDVIDMVLLHDLGETLTGDIPHPNKKSDDDLKEDLKVKALGIGLVYLDCPFGERFLRLWNEWNLNFTTSAKVAHDLDVVQLNNQLLNYAVKYPDYFTIEELKLWYRRRPIHPIGLDIFNKVIQSDDVKKQMVKEIL